MATQAAAAKTQVSEGTSKYQALTNISVPQRDPETGKLNDQNDLVDPGDIVELTERQARNLMDTGLRSGRQSPAIRPYSERNQPMPRLVARNLSGFLRTPAPPPADSDMPRPDPPGSSKIIEQKIPELAEPQPGDENAPPPIVGAIDIPPRRS
jgi:hypothetical protein